jgi:signal transduction histidine kinase
MPLPRQRWSLTRRIGLLLALLSVAPVALATAIGVSYLGQSVRRELRTLTREEIEEAHNAALTTDDPGANFDRIAERLRGEHPTVRMAWRLHDGAGAVVRDIGPAALLEHIAVRTTDLEVRELAPGLFTVSGPLNDDLSATLVLDGTEQLERVGDYWLVGIATMAISLLLSLVAARFVAGRFGRLLDTVAHRIRRDSEDDSGDRDDDGQLPVELEPIAAELRRMLQNIEQRARDAKVFTTGLAHELRSPIQNLIGEAEVALLRPRAADDYRSLLGRQVQELHEFARAVDNLLFLCSADEPGRQVSWETFDLDRETQVRLEGERAQADAREIALRFEVLGDCEVSADREAVLRSVRNLVSNAIKWSPQHTEVRVVLDGRDRDLAVEVHDAGPGVPPGDRERLFTPFLVGATPPGQRAGFGLGLAITRAAAALHGGTVTIADSPLGGALLRFVLPRRVRPTATDDAV